MSCITELQQERDIFMKEKALKNSIDVKNFRSFSSNIMKIFFFLQHSTLQSASIMPPAFPPPPTSTPPQVKIFCFQSWFFFYFFFSTKVKRSLSTDKVDIKCKKCEKSVSNNETSLFGSLKQAVSVLDDGNFEKKNIFLSKTYYKCFIF